MLRIRRTVVGLQGGPHVLVIDKRWSRAPWRIRYIGASVSKVAGVVSFIVITLSEAIREQPVSQI